jgi:hypothetical protein
VLFLAGRGVKALKLEKTGDSFSAKELWNNPDKSVQFNSPVLKGGALYGLTPANELFCLNAQNGQLAWSAPTAPASASPAAGAGAGAGAAAAEQPAPGAPPGGGGPGGGRGRGGRGGGGGGAGYGSLVDAGSVMLALTPSSELIAFQSSDKTYTELARIKVADTPTHAHPVVSGNRIFIKDKDSLTLWTVD